MNEHLKKNYYFIVLSIIFSAIVHLFILFAAYKLGVFSFSPVLEEERTNYKIRLIKTPDVLEKKLIAASKNKDREKEKPKRFSSTENVAKIDLSSNTSDKIDILPEMVSDQVFESREEEKVSERFKEYEKESYKLPTIIEIDGDKLPRERKRFNRLIIPKLPRDFGESKFSFNPDDYSLADSGELPVFKVGNKLKTPNKVSSNRAEYLPESSNTSLFPTERATPMDLMIDVKLYKFPLKYDNGFFRIDLKPNKRASALRSFRKDIIFLLDISGSIGRPRLDEMKSGIFSTLASLHPQDRFNIIAFSSSNQPLFRVPMHPNNDTIRAADEFLFKLRHKGTTNIFSALDVYIGGKYRAGSRPLIVFLVSDGNVNAGRIVGNSELINAVSNKNDDGAHIYTFACGGNKNSFLMDLLAYRNRGESKYLSDIAKSHLDLASFIYDVSDVKVSDLEYQISSNLAENTFPKRLENLYKGKTLSLYGYYSSGTKEVGLRITGRDSSGVYREIVFSGEIAKAEIASKDLPKKWAEQVIYHLYSLLTVKYDEKIRDEILNTAHKFNLKLPYLEEHVKPERRQYVK